MPPRPLKRSSQKRLPQNRSDQRSPLRRGFFCLRNRRQKCDQEPSSAKKRAADKPRSQTPPSASPPLQSCLFIELIFAGAAPVCCVPIRHFNPPTDLATDSIARPQPLSSPTQGQLPISKCLADSPPFNGSRVALRRGNLLDGAGLLPTALRRTTSQQRRRPQRGSDQR